MLQEANNRKLALGEPGEFQAYPGAGVSARTEAGTVLVGTRRLVEEKDGLYAVRPSELALIRYYANSIAHLAA